MRKFPLYHPSDFIKEILGYFALCRSSSSYLKREQVYTGVHIPGRETLRATSWFISTTLIVSSTVLDTILCSVSCVLVSDLLNKVLLHPGICIWKQAHAC